MTVDPFEQHYELITLYEGTFCDPVVFPPGDFPPGSVVLRKAVRTFVAEVARREIAAFELPEIEKLALPIRDALLDGRLRVTCIARNGPHRDVDPTAFWDRQTWRATFEEGVELPMRPSAGIEPGFLITSDLAFRRFATSLRAERALNAEGTTYTPRILNFVVRAVRRLGIEGGRYHGDDGDLVAALSELAREEKIVLGGRAIGYIAQFIIDPNHYQNGWNSSIPPIFEFLLEMVDIYGVREGRRFNRKHFAGVILKHAASRPDLGILPTHTTYLTTICGNPQHSRGGSSPRKDGAPDTRLSKVRTGSR